jgi:hypothetical protein
MLQIKKPHEREQIQSLKKKTEYDDEMKKITIQRGKDQAPFFPTITSADNADVEKIN